jgi:hypothetical protein
MPGVNRIWQQTHEHESIQPADSYCNKFWKSPGQRLFAYALPIADASKAC